MGKKKRGKIEIDRGKGEIRKADFQFSIPADYVEADPTRWNKNEVKK